MRTTRSLPTFIRKVGSIYPISSDEELALASLSMQERSFRADQEIVREGDRLSRCFVVLEGFVQRYKQLGDGRRQIMAFHIPGDIPDLLSFNLPRLDHDLGTLCACKLGFITHADIRHAIRSHPRIGDALWRNTLVEAAILREWIIGIGRRPASVRIAHLLCEIIVRMRTNGLIDDHAARLPLTQSTLADALGLSTVHANRCIQDLRGKGIISWKKSEFAVIDWPALQKFGEFDISYLHLDLE